MKELAGNAGEQQQRHHPAALCTGRLTAGAHLARAGDNQGRGEANVQLGRVNWYAGTDRDMESSPRCFSMLTPGGMLVPECKCGC